jgi:RNA polymerase sigma-70 factor (ECF subfamily)
MVQPHLTSSSPSHPLHFPPAFEVAHSPANTLVGKRTSGADANAEFRAGLLSATPHLRAFAISLIGQREAADDLVQDTLVRALQYRSRFEPGTNLQAWLITMLRNLFYSDHRKHKREVEDVDGLYAAKLSTPPEQPGRIEFAALEVALAKIPDEQREAVLLVGAEGYSYEEAADICATKIGTIKSRVNRARRRLAELLGHEHEGDVGPDGVGV